MIAIECHGICKMYGGAGRRQRRVRALDGVSLEVEAGTTLGIVGESGSGKSTLGRLLCGLEDPDAGSVSLFDQSVAELGADLRTTIQPVFQDPYTAINPRDTIARALAEVFVSGLRTKRRLAPRAAQMAASLSEVGLPAEMLSRRPSELSGGQLQRVLLARALLKDPKILVCDEPTASLDVSIQAQVLNLLVRLQQDRNLTMVFISHDLRIIHHISDSILVLRDGRVREFGAAEQIWDAPSDPYTQELLSSVSGECRSARTPRASKG